VRETGRLAVQKRLLAMRLIVIIIVIIGVVIIRELMVPKCRKNIENCIFIKL
jgi:hypothetical protein